MTTPFEVIMLSYQSSGAGLKAVFRFHPHDNPEIVKNAPPGARFAMALVRIADDESLEPAKPNQHVQRAGMLCQDTMFHHFLMETYPDEWRTSNGATMVEAATNLFRRYCHIQSRKELATSEPALIKMHELEVKFERWKRGE